MDVGSGIHDNNMPNSPQVISRGGEESPESHQTILQYDTSSTIGECMYRGCEVPTMGSKGNPTLFCDGHRMRGEQILEHSKYASRLLFPERHLKRTLSSPTGPEIKKALRAEHLEEFVNLRRAKDPLTMLPHRSSKRPNGSNPQTENNSAISLKTLMSNASASDSDEDGIDKQLVQELDRSNSRRFSNEHNSDFNQPSPNPHIEMSDAECFEVAHETLDQPMLAASTPSGRGNMQGSTRGGQSGDSPSLGRRVLFRHRTSIDSDEVMEEDTHWLADGHSNRETGRPHDDQTESIDEWFYREPVLPADEQPSEKDLLDTQEWGQINPCKVWPEELSQKWMQDKRAEIKARGGRKANFGKLITSQMQQERRDSGWGAHQVKDVSPITEERREVARKVDEMFGVKDTSEMVPALKNGNLYMVDAQEESVHGRGQRKSVRSYLVG